MRARPSAARGPEMATVTREREALIEWLTDAVARLPERHELGDIRDAIAVALASAPPAAPPGHLAARQSDPPGLVALLNEPHFIGWPKTAAAGEYAYSRDAVMVSAEWYERLKALALPASPQAETMPTIQVGDVVRVADSVAVIGSANAASFWGRQVLDAIYRDPLWRRPTKGDE